MQRAASRGEGGRRGRGDPALDRRSIAAYIFLAELFLEAKEKDRALHILKEMTDANPESALGFRRLAEFYFEQALRSLKDCMKQALLKRGVPTRFYVDNGRIFRSRPLLVVAARLGILLLHTRPYRPQGRAKLERWFGHVRRSFLSQLEVNRIEDLGALNRLLFAWIEGHYHQRPHRGLDGETPLDRWMRLSEGIRFNKPVSLCLLDLDHFKQINDTYGHLAGDRVLATFGQLLSSRFRTMDVRGRWGGEEFAVAFYGEDADTAKMIINRVLDELKTMVFTGDKGEQFKVTFSAGVATFPLAGKSIEDLFRYVDEKLYLAKERGRSRIEC